MTACRRITPRARADLVAIARYTRDVWDVAKRDAYLGRLTARFDGSRETRSSDGRGRS